MWNLEIPLIYYLIDYPQSIIMCTLLRIFYPISYIMCTLCFVHIFTFCLRIIHPSISQTKFLKIKQRKNRHRGIKQTTESNRSPVRQAQSPRKLQSADWQNKLHQATEKTIKTFSLSETTALVQRLCVHSCAFSRFRGNKISVVWPLLDKYTTTQELAQ